jgi:hypothetical protein
MLVAFGCGLGAGFLAGVFVTCVVMILRDDVRAWRDAQHGRIRTLPPTATGSIGLSKFGVPIYRQHFDVADSPVPVPIGLHFVR